MKNFFIQVLIVFVFGVSILLITGNIVQPDISDLEDKIEELENKVNNSQVLLFNNYILDDYEGFINIDSLDNYKYFNIFVYVEDWHFVRSYFLSEYIPSFVVFEETQYGIIQLEFDYYDDDLYMLFGDSAPVYLQIWGVK